MLIVTIQIKSNKNIQLIYQKHNYSILELLETNNIKINYQCRSGYCGTCRLTLLNGNIKYHQKPLAYIHPNECLPCFCFPINKIKLKI